MHFLSHLSYPYVFANLVALLFGKTISWEYNLLIILFSLFPDFDYVPDYIRQKFKTGKYKIPNHHSFPSHWPIVYVPLIIVALVTLEPFFIIAATAIYLHLFMDVFFCNQGIMVFYPFSKKWYNFMAKKTANKNGFDWNKAYKTLWISYVDKVFVLLMITHIAIFLIYFY